MNRLRSPFSGLRLITLEGVLDSCTPRNLWSHPQILSGAGPAIVVHDFESAVHLYAPGLPWIDGLQVIDRHGSLLGALQNVPVPHRPEEDLLRPASKPEVLAVKFKSDGDHI